MNMPPRRIAKIIVTAVVATAAVAVYVRDKVVPSAETALVVGSKSRMGAPLGGWWKAEAPSEGGIVARGSILGRISAAPELDRDVQSLERELALAKQASQTLVKLVSQGQTFGSALAKEDAVYTKRRWEQLYEAARSDAQEVDARQAVLDLAKAQVKRIAALADEGSASASDLQMARADEAVAAAALERAKGSHDIGGVVLESFRQGVDLGTTVANPSAPRHKLQDLTMQVGSLRLALDQSVTRQRVLEEQLKAAAQADVKAPTTLIVWQRHKLSGAYAKEGDTLLDAVDCDDLFVLAAVNADAYEKLKVGTEATVVAPGWGGRKLRTKVARLMGALVGARVEGDSGYEPQLPVASSGRDQLYGVLLPLPSPAGLGLAACPLGTKLSARFEP